MRKARADRLRSRGYVPIGMALDPRTVGFDSLDLHRATAYERNLQAKLLTGYCDLVYDTDPDFTVRNQLFYDSMDQFKVSNQPVSQKQWIYVWEDKLTMTKRFARLPSWLRVESLASVASVNFRDTVADGYHVPTGDYSTHRTDAMAPSWNPWNEGMTANTTFATPLDNPDIQNDGAPWTSIYATRFWEIGAGVLFNVDLFQHTNLTFGGRFDGSEARNTDFSVLNINTGTSANPGAYTDSSTTRGWDQGLSWNVSVTQAFARNFRAYATVAHSSIALDANNNALTSAVIKNGHIGTAVLKEAGVKASLLEERLFFTVAGYEQSRLTAADEDPSVASGAYATATTTRGVELEIKWVPMRNLFASVYATHQRTRFDPDLGGGDAGRRAHAGIPGRRGFARQRNLSGGSVPLRRPKSHRSAGQHARLRDETGQSGNAARHERALSVPPGTRAYVQRQLFFQHLFGPRMRGDAAGSDGSQCRCVLGARSLERESRCAEFQQPTLVPRAQRRLARRSARAGDARSPLATHVAVRVLGRVSKRARVLQADKTLIVPGGP